LAGRAGCWPRYWLAVARARRVARTLAGVDPEGEGIQVAVVGWVKLRGERGM
jgi:hypothetical protein